MIANSERIAADLTARESASLDPITLSVIMNRLKAIANEMTLTLEFTAWTPILAQTRDFSCAIFTNDGKQVCMNDGLPLHVNSNEYVLKEIAAAFAGKLFEGDVIACNDPHRGNTHIGDLTTACPVFVDGHHMFWCITKGHQLDTGAYIPSSTPSSARDVYQEGLTISPLKFYERGSARDDVIELYLTNVRYRHLLKGDLMAQLGSIWTGERRLKEFVGKYGRETFNRYLAELFSYSDRRMQAQIRSMPRGEYVGESWIDSDGAGHTNTRIQATVVIGADHVHVGLEGSDPQVAGAANASFAVMQAAATIPVICCVDPSIPHNYGSLRHVSASAQAGSVCYAKHPAATALATVIPGDIIQDAVWKALAKAMPERVSAGWGRIQCTAFLSGRDVRAPGEPVWGFYFMNACAGGGAAPQADGWPVTMTPAGMGGMKTPSIEMTELLYPMLVEKLEIQTDSMGHGKHIGGPRMRASFRPIGAPIESHVLGDGADNPPFGVCGGTPGIGGGNYTEDCVTGHRTYYSAKGHVVIEINQRWESVATGGGGYGDPLERPPARVAEDARNGVISMDSALGIYGVVLSATTFEVDAKRTAAKRNAMRRSPSRHSGVVPDRPGAATWLAEHRRQGEEFRVDAE